MRPCLMQTAVAIILWHFIPFLNTPVTFATIPSSPAPSPNQAVSDNPSDRYQALCTGTQEAPPELATQWKEYCQAAFTAKEAHQANKSLVMVYAGVAAVCTTACVTSFFAPIPLTGTLCMGATAAGAVYDVVKTKQYTSAITSIGALGASLLLNNSLNKDTPTSGSNSQGQTTGGEGGTPSDAGPKPPEQPSKKDIGSCIQAAVAGVQAFMKHSAAKTDEKTANLNLDHAESLKAQAMDYIAILRNPGDPHSPQNPNASGSTAPRVQTGLTSSQNQGNLNRFTLSSNNNKKGGGIYTSGSSCQKAASAMDFKSQLNCAISANPRLPKAARDPRFPEAIRTATGLNPNDFAREVNRSGPAGAIQKAGNSFGPANPDGTKILGSALKNLESSFGDGSEPSSLYASGSSGGSSGAASTAAASSQDPNINQLISDVMDKLLPKNAGENSDSTSADSQLEKRDSEGNLILGQNALDRNLSTDKTEELKLSLFIRVSKRYFLLTPQILMLEVKKDKNPIGGR